MAKKMVVKKAAVKGKAVKESNEVRIVKLLKSGAYTVKEIVKAIGCAEASARMYVSQGYLKAKGKPYKVTVSEKAGEKAYTYA
jgi:DNA-binding CsgD family transcriptional regulator